METLKLPKSVLLKEIIRYEEDTYILNAEMVLSQGWDTRTSSVYLRANIKMLAEILRLENPTQSRSIEELFLTMLSFGEPKRIDIQELTGNYLLLSNCELVVRTSEGSTAFESVHNMPTLVDVFPKLKIDPLETFLNIEKEFSKEILEKTFYDFQKTFFLMERGYTLDAASAMTQTNNAISAMIYDKIKQQLDPEEASCPIVSQSREEVLEENFGFNEFVNSENDAVPF